MRNGVCLLALSWLTGGTLSASPQGDLAIRGLVSELGTTQPVADAEISISFLGAEQPQIINPAALQKPLATAKTDVMGAFAFRLEDTGYYIVSVKKAGYNSAGPTAQTIALTTTAPSREVRLILSRPGQLTGSVVDADTGKPIQGLKVSLRSVVERLGGRALLGQAIAFTDREGEVLPVGLPPGGDGGVICPPADP